MRINRKRFRHIAMGGWIIPVTVSLLLAGCATFKGSHRKVVAPPGMVYVPPGWFIMGSDPSDGKPGRVVGVGEIPRHKVYVKGFFIDKYEVSVGEYKKFLQATGRKPPRMWIDPTYVAIYPIPEDNHPVTGVSWYDADAYCRWAGKRLPTEAEWEKAARGTDGRIFPWGNYSSLPGNPKANTMEAGHNWTVPVDSYPEGVSPYGVYNMTGNVWEWTSSWYEPYPGSKLDKKFFGNKKYKVLRGGSWENPLVPFGRVTYRHAVAPEWDHPGHGFRCAKDAE